MIDALQGNRNTWKRTVAAMRKVMMASDSAQPIPERHLKGVKMARAYTRGSIVVVLAALGIIVVGALEAKAAPSSPPLVISKGIVIVSPGPIGPDPQYTYQFNVTLSPNGIIDANSLSSLNPLELTSFTVDNLTGLSSSPPPGNQDTVSGPPGWLGMVSVGQPIISGTMPPTSTPTTDVTWTYLGGPQIGPTTNPVPLGTFGITFFNAATVGPTTSTSYNISIDGTPPSDPIHVDFALAPEPSTAIAPLMVLLGLPFVLLLKRRNARARQQVA